MNWLERLENIKLEVETGDGETYFPLWREAEKNIQFNTEGFDFIGVKGFVFITQMGEISIHAKELILLSKSLKPLPIVKEKDGTVYDAVTDPEFRYRQRYVDLIVNPWVKDIFIKRKNNELPP